jgi:hypothetical protein
VAVADVLASLIIYWRCKEHMLLVRMCYVQCGTWALWHSGNAHGLAMALWCGQRSLGCRSFGDWALGRQQRRGSVDVSLGM